MPWYRKGQKRRDEDGRARRRREPQTGITKADFLDRRLNRDEEHDLRLAFSQGLHLTGGGVQIEDGK